MNLGGRILRGIDRMLGGSTLIESVLLALLGQYYASRLRLHWYWPGEDGRPHFFEHRIGMFQFAFGTAEVGPYPYNRGFFGSQVIRNGDVLLDIGCGDGFMTKRFFGSRCAAVDGIDIEPSAIETARAQNSSPRISYHQMDATSATWPRPRYDVVVWDGALGHFAEAITHQMLDKIGAAIGEQGVFAGSESLGREGDDHLQFFESPEDLRRILAPHFKFVALHEEHYRIGAGILRREGYWRCTQDPARAAEWTWR
jgi:SAM-dependent methyltransferase